MNDSNDEALYHLDCRANYLKKRKSSSVSDFQHIEELINLDPSRMWTSIDLFEIFNKNKKSIEIQTNLKQARKNFLKDLSKYFGDKFVFMHVSTN